MVAPQSIPRNVPDRRPYPRRGHNFLELRWGEVRRIYLPRTSVNRRSLPEAINLETGVLTPRSWLGLPSFSTSSRV